MIFLFPRWDMLIPWRVTQLMVIFGWTGFRRFGFPIGSPEMMQGLLLGDRPKIPNHRAPNHQFTISWITFCGSIQSGRFGRIKAGSSTVGVNDLVLEAGCYLFIYSTSLLFCIARDSTPPTMKILFVPWDICQESGKRGFHGFRSWWGEVSMFSCFDLSSSLWLTNPRDVLRSDSPPSSVGTHLNLESIEASGRLRVMLSLVGNLTQCGKSCSPTCRTDWHNFFVNPPQDILVSSLKCWFGRSKRLVWAFFRVGLVTVFKQMRAFLMGHQLNSTILWCWIYFSSYTRSFPLILKC